MTPEQNKIRYVSKDMSKEDRDYLKRLGYEVREESDRALHELHDKREKALNDWAEASNRAISEQVMNESHEGGLSALLRK